MGRKLMVEMDPLEYSRFQLFERLIKRLHDKNPNATDEKIVEILAGSFEEMLNPKKK
jgi:hypothetical protein